MNLNVININMNLKRRRKWCFSYKLRCCSLKWRVKMTQNPEVWILNKQHSIWRCNSLSETFLFELILFIKKFHPFKIWLKGAFSLSLSQLSVCGRSRRAPRHHSLLSANVQILVWYPFGMPCWSLICFFFSQL